MMNYIELINSFWQMNTEHSFTGNETQVYFKLLDTCNSLGWKNPFNYSNSHICGEIGISEPSFLRSRNKLHQAGLIEFISGKVKREKTIYTLLELKKITVSSEKCLDKIKLSKTNIFLKKESKEDFSFLKNLIDFGASEVLATDFLETRKTKKATNSKTAFKLFIKQVELSKKPIDEILELCISKDWKGFQAGWLNNLEFKNSQYGISNNKSGSNQNNRYKPATVDTEKLIRELANDATAGNIPGMY